MIGLPGATAFAGICDYRPSELIGGVATSAVAATSAAAASAGAGMQAAGFYTLVHSSSGLTMLGSTFGGASAAGTVGIMGGTGGAIGGTASVVMAPAFIVAAAGAAVGVSGLEGVCYFQDERITDYGQVRRRMLDIASHSDPDYFQFIEAEKPSGKAFIAVRNGEGKFDAYDVANLYIVNGVLMHRDWFLNTEIGNIAWQVSTTVEN